MKCPSPNKLINDLTFKADIFIYRQAVKQWRVIGATQNPLCQIALLLALPVIMIANIVVGTVVNVFAILKNCYKMQGVKVLVGVAMLPLRPILTAIVIGAYVLSIPLAPIVGIAFAITMICRARFANGVQ